MSETLGSRDLQPDRTLPMSNAPANTDAVPVVPGYEIIAEVGRGGMGVVYRAWQSSLARMVALKMLRPSDDPRREEIVRLKGEAEAIGRLHHPNIMQIFDVGELAGRPILVMEFVEGGSLAARLEKVGKLPPDEAASLFETLARAIHHAHSRGIVHRDLSPGNVLLAEADGKPTIPKVADFGLAKLIVGGDDDRTRTGTVIGTPSYMAPEQAEGLVRLVGPRTDVYGLGGVLYAALTGRPPFRADTGWQTARMVVDAEPIRPSTLVPGLPRDLETICLKCLRKDQARRYGSAEELADDLRRFQNREPIAARRVGAGERLRLWIRRNPALASTAVVAFAAVVLTAAVGLRQVLAERDQAKAHLYRALLSDARAQMKARDTDWWSAATDNIRQAAKLDVPDRDPAELRDLLAECHGTEYANFRLLDTWDGSDSPVTATAFRPDGRLVATATADGVVRLRSVPDGATLARLDGHTKVVTSLAFHPDGRRLASGSRDGTVRIWDLDAPGAGRVVRFVAWVNALDFSADGASLAVGRDNGAVDLLPTSGDGPPRIVGREESAITALAFQPGRPTLAVAVLRKGVRLRDLESGRELVDFPFANFLPSIAFDPSGGTFATADVESWGYNVRHVANVDFKGAFGHLHSNAALKVAFAATIGPEPFRCWMTASADGTIRAWRNATSTQVKEMAVARGDFGPLKSMAVNADATRVVAGYLDGRTRLWELSCPPARTVPWTPNFGPGIAFVGGGRRLFQPAVAHDFGPGNAVETKLVSERRDYFWCVAASPDGRWVAIGMNDGSVEIWDARSLRRVHVLTGHVSQAWCAAFSPDSTLLASGGECVRLWDVATGREIRQFDTTRHLVRGVAFHPGGTWLAACAKDEFVHAWDVESGRRIGEPVKVERELSGLAFRPDGRRLAGSGFDQIVRVWDLPDGAWTSAAPTWRLTGHRSEVWSVRYSPDGRWLATGSDRGVTLSDGETHARLVNLRGVEGQVRSLSFSGDGELLAAGSYVRPATVWRLPKLRATLADAGLDW